MGEISRANRQFEFFLFGGVPETPEGLYELNSNARAFGRLTGQPVGGAPLPSPLAGDGEVVARFRLDRRTREITFHPATRESPAIEVKRDRKPRKRR
jgi:hypothetical protein